MFSLFLASNEKVLNTNFAKFFEIYNFRVMHFFIRAMVWELFNYFKNCHLKYLSFHVNFGTFTPRFQLGFCLTWHGEYVYLFSYACLHCFESYFNFLTTRNWTLVYLICLNLEFAKKSFKLNYVSQKYECVFILHFCDQLSMKVQEY